MIKRMSSLSISIIGALVIICTHRRFSTEITQLDDTSIQPPLQSEGDEIKRVIALNYQNHMQRIRISVWCAVLTIWPFVWETLSHGCDTYSHAIFTIPFLIMVVETMNRHAIDERTPEDKKASDSNFITEETNTTDVSVIYNGPRIRIDPNTMCSISLALYGVLGSRMMHSGEGEEKSALQA